VFSLYARSCFHAAHQVAPNQISSQPLIQYYKYTVFIGWSISSFYNWNFFMRYTTNAAATTTRLFIISGPL